MPADARAEMAAASDAELRARSDSMTLAEIEAEATLTETLLEAHRAGATPEELAALYAGER